MREHMESLGPLIVLGWLYRDVPNLVPYTVKLARYGIVTVASLFLPYSIYGAWYGSPSWSPHQPMRLVVIELLAGLGTFLAFCWASVVLILDAKRMP